MEKRPILTIDDDPITCELIDAILTEAGFEVLSAPDGPSGIERARMARPGTIILDLMLPGLDGIAVCQRLKHDPVLLNIPVIAITASSELKWSEEAFYAGAEFFLSKPFRAANLISVVRLGVETTQRDIRVYLRMHSRLEAELPVRIFNPWDRENSRGIVSRAENVSHRGLLIWLPEIIPAGTVVRLQLGLPQGEVTAEGQVIWHDYELGDRPIPHGIRLVQFEEKAGEKQYRRYLSKLPLRRTW